MKRRFSPGYSDMSLEMQKKIFKLLKPENIGINLSPSCLMIPEKSVTAFVGIENG
jgi:cobalamin-dependent methionine synthase I